MCAFCNRTLCLSCRRVRAGTSGRRAILRSRWEISEQPPNHESSQPKRDRIQTSAKSGTLLKKNMKKPKQKTHYGTQIKYKPLQKQSTWIELHGLLLTSSDQPPYNDQPGETTPRDQNKGPWKLDSQKLSSWVKPQRLKLQRSRSESETIPRLKLLGRSNDVKPHAAKRTLGVLRCRFVSCPRRAQGKAATTRNPIGLVPIQPPILPFRPAGVRLRESCNPLTDLRRKRHGPSKRHPRTRKTKVGPFRTHHTRGWVLPELSRAPKALGWRGLLGMGEGVVGQGVSRLLRGRRRRRRSGRRREGGRRALQRARVARRGLGWRQDARPVLPELFQRALYPDIQMHSDPPVATSWRVFHPVLVAAAHVALPGEPFLPQASLGPGVPFHGPATAALHVEKALHSLIVEDPALANHEKERSSPGAQAKPALGRKRLEEPSARSRRRE